MKKSNAKPKNKVQVWVVHRTTPEANTDTKFLLLKVISKRGSGWHPITGGADVGDRSLFASAKREFREETGITPKIYKDLKWKNLNFNFSFAGRFGPAVEHAFMVVITGRKPRIQLDPIEHTAYEWVSESKVRQRLRRRPLQLECFNRVLYKLLRQLH